jgi:hypothetical protein
MKLNCDTHTHLKYTISHNNCILVQQVKSVRMNLILTCLLWCRSCILDMCECPTRRCHCESFTAYAHECKRLGVHLPDWRTSTGCPSAWTEHKRQAPPRNRPPLPRLH